LSRVTKGKDSEKSKVEVPEIEVRDSQFETASKKNSH